VTPREATAGSSQLVEVQWIFNREQKPHGVKFPADRMRADIRWSSALTSSTMPKSGRRKLDD